MPTVTCPLTQTPIQVAKDIRKKVQMRAYLWALADAFNNSSDSYSQLATDIHFVAAGCMSDKMFWMLKTLTVQFPPCTLDDAPMNDDDYDMVASVIDWLKSNDFFIL